MYITNQKIYDLLKYLARYILPALATLYVALADTWGFPYKVEISATISAIVVFLNVLLGISNENYTKAIAQEIATDSQEQTE